MSLPTVKARASIPVHIASASASVWISHCGTGRDRVRDSSCARRRGLRGRALAAAPGRSAVRSQRVPWWNVGRAGAGVGVLVVETDFPARRGLPVRGWRINFGARGGCRDGVIASSGSARSFATDRGIRRGGSAGRVRRARETSPRREKVGLALLGVLRSAHGKLRLQVARCDRALARGAAAGQGGRGRPGHGIADAVRPSVGARWSRARGGCPSAHESSGPSWAQALCCGGGAAHGAPRACRSCGGGVRPILRYSSSSAATSRSAAIGRAGAPVSASGRIERCGLQHGVADVATGECAVAGELAAQRGVGGASSEMGFPDAQAFGRARRRKLDDRIEAAGEGAVDAAAIVARQHDDARVLLDAREEEVGEHVGVALAGVLALAAAAEEGIGFIDQEDHVRRRGFRPAGVRGSSRTRRCACSSPRTDPLPGTVGAPREMVPDRLAA